MVPRISVLVNTYNHERYIEQAVTSVLEQDFPCGDMEVLVVDDGSTDATPKLVSKFTPRVRLLQKKNGGQASAFNTGIPELRGEVVAFLDGDDWWPKQKLRRVAEAIEQHPEVAAIGHGFYMVRNNEPPHEVFVPAETCRLDLATLEAAYIADQGRTLLGTSRLSIRRNVLNRIGRLPEALVFCADTPILTLALMMGGAIVLDTPLCYYRQHSGSLFAHDPQDKARLRRRLSVLGFLLEYLPPRLAELGASREVIDALFASDRVALERIKIQFGDGGRWNSFRAEWRNFRASYRAASIGYVAFQCAVSACALLLSPREFGRLRNWYVRSNIPRFGRTLGTTQPRVPKGFFVRRSVSVECLTPESISPKSI